MHEVDSSLRSGRLYQSMRSTPYEDKVYSTILQGQHSDATRSNIANKVWADLLHLLQFNNMAATSVNDGLLSLLSCQLRALRHNGGVHEHSKIAAPTVVKWMHPPTGRLKLNVGGAFKLANSGASGGGILRDHEGRFVFSFAKNYQGAIFALDAETRALRDGLTICCNKGILDILVETDSLHLKRIVTSQMHHT
ncbi:hypothetical protein Taro_025554 [Colocasia esculenta]|uniref:RNase H type-1 domain-containing protein n=1 Tax=Colocasia esculenta TaxID=4460 RepID=A0A843VGW3_COLES|nr:hypothetical protein [Colocasia esculenta]